jgi:hypothetical protein
VVVLLPLATKPLLERGTLSSFDNTSLAVRAVPTLGGGAVESASGAMLIIGSGGGGGAELWTGGAIELVVELGGSVVSDGMSAVETFTWRPCSSVAQPTVGFVGSGSNETNGIRVRLR